MSLRQTIRGMFWFFLIVVLANYEVGEGASVQTLYVCNTRPYSQCPDKSYPTLSDAVNAAGRRATRIILLEDTEGTTIPSTSNILGLYANRHIVSTPIVVEKTRLKTMDIVGIRFKAKSGKDNILDMKGGVEASIIDNCLEGGSVAISSRDGGMRLENNLFLENTTSLVLNKVGLKSRGDSFYGIKRTVTDITKRNARFAETTIAKVGGSSSAAIKVSDGLVVFNGLDVSDVEAFALFGLYGKTTGLTIVGSQIYNNSNLPLLIYIFAVMEDIRHLKIKDTIIKDNAGGVLFATPQEYPETIEVNGLYADMNDGHFAKPEALTARTSISIQDSLITGNGKVNGRAHFIAPSFYSSGSNLMNFGGFEFNTHEKLLIESSIMEAVVTKQYMNISSKSTNFTGVKMLLGEDSSMVFDPPLGEATLKGVYTDFSYIDASNLSQLSITEGTFMNGFGLELALAGGNSLELNDFDVPSGGLSFEVSGHPVTARNNIFRPVVGFSRGGVVGGIPTADFSSNYWGEEGGDMDAQRQVCTNNNVNCNDPLASKPAVPQPKYSELVMRDVVPRSPRKECAALRPETKEYISATFGGDPFKMVQEEEER